MLLYAPRRLCTFSLFLTSRRDTCRRATALRFRASNEGFGRQASKKSKRASADSQPLQGPKSLSEVAEGDDNLAPRLTSMPNLQQENMKVDDMFEEKLNAIKRSAEEEKRLEQERMYGPIDYDAPETPQESKMFGLPAKIGIGVAVVIFGLIFAFGDIFPSGPTSVQKAGVSSSKNKTLKDSAQLKEDLQRFLSLLKDDPDNLDALEGAAVSYAEAGEFTESKTMLLQLLKKKPRDVEVLRLLGEVQNALGEFADSASSYRNALKISPKSITLWKGLAEVLVSQGKPDLAVKEIGAERDLLTSTLRSMDDTRQNSDPDEATLLQISLLLGKIYIEWGHVSDALAVYDSVIKNDPDDFRGYLAKGILLKKEGLKGEAERMFIQASFLAPESMKVLVDRYAKG